MGLFLQAAQGWAGSAGRVAVIAVVLMPCLCVHARAGGWSLLLMAGQKQRFEVPGPALP